MNPRKECFGVLDNVFPMGCQGLREVRPTCFECPDRTACLKAALDSREGLELRNRVLDRSPATGFWDHLKRWSDRKELKRRLSAKEKGKA